MRLLPSGLLQHRIEFQFTHPGRGATRLCPCYLVRKESFNSRTPGGVRPLPLCPHLSYSCFNSRTPGGVRQDTPKSVLVSSSVSIHAPREGCDFALSIYYVMPYFVSIHAPREGCDVALTAPTDRQVKFQFTHPGRGATPFGLIFNRSKYVSIHAPREGCDSVLDTSRRFPGGFNSRTPGGVRQRCNPSALWLLEFQFTHPGRGATPDKPYLIASRGVSIHAPREGCDRLAPPTTLVISKVSIHAPREGCDILLLVKQILRSMFQFTHPGRGATGRRFALACY